MIIGADLPAAIDELTDGRGVDVVIDPVGGELRAQAFERTASPKTVLAIRRR